MEFSEVKRLILYMESHPYIILHNLKLFAHPDWCNILKQVVSYIENKQNENDEEAIPLNEEELEKLMYGLMLLPAIMLQEEHDESWNIYFAIILLMQNYAQDIGSENLQNLVENLSVLIQAKNSIKALILQTESLTIQNQAVLSNTQTPYNLSSVFLRSLLDDQEKENA